MKLSRAEVRPCPCGDADCGQWVVYPFFNKPEAAMLVKEVAEELVRRINAGESLVNEGAKQ